MKIKIALKPDMHSDNNTGTLIGTRVVATDVGIDTKTDEIVAIDKTVKTGMATKTFDPSLPTVDQCNVPSWALHIDCPHCGDILNDWLVNPEHTIVECSSCNQKFNISRNLALVIT